MVSWWPTGFVSSAEQGAALVAVSTYFWLARENSLSQESDVYVVVRCLSSLGSKVQPPLLLAHYFLLVLGGLAGLLSWEMVGRDFLSGGSQSWPFFEHEVGCSHRSTMTLGSSR